MSPNSLLILVVCVAAALGIVAQWPWDPPRSRVLRFLRVHAETALYALIFVFSLAVLGPTLDKAAEDRHAMVAQLTD
jgi:hypothetical protein